MILTKSSENSIDLDFEINKKIELKSLDSLLLIIPTNRKIRYLTREIINLTPGQSTGNLNLETLGTFSTKILFKETQSNSRVLSEAAASVLLKQSFQEVELKYFSGYGGDIPAGTLERVRNVISEYKRHGITPSLLQNEAAKLSGADKFKAEDIACIYEAYQKKCEQLNVKEIGDIYREVNQKTQPEFEDSFREMYPDVNLIIINGFDEFTSPEIEIINSSASVKNAKLFLSFDYFKFNPLIFSHLDDCYKKLEAKGFRVIEDRSAGSHSKFQVSVREKLFRHSGNEKIKDFEHVVNKITALTREKEIELIAKEIKDLITEKGIDPHHICIVFNLIQNYSPIIRDIFPVYGIPFNLTDRFLLSTSYPVITIISFLEIIENDFYYKNIFRALSGGYFSLPGIDLSNLLKVSVKLKIISGYDNWITTIKEAAAQLNGSEEDGMLSFSSEGEVYRKAIKDLEKLNKFLSPFKHKMTLREFHWNLKDFINKLRLSSRLINDCSPAIEKNVKAVSVFIDTIEELFHLLEEEYKEETKFPLKFFLNQIRTSALTARYNIKEVPGYGVQVTTLNEIRGLQFDYLFISGLCDGDFPTRYTPEIFFSGSYFRKEQSHQTEERYHFYQSLCSWTKGLYLTVPLNEEHRELAESTFLSEFADLFHFSEKREDDYSNKIYSQEELLKYIGENGIEAGEDQSIGEVNLEQIKKSLEINKLRTNDPYGDSPYTGSIFNNLSDEGKNKLEKFRERQFSTTQLETYAKCPYKYFAERVLRLEAIEEPSEEIEALEMGSLLHTILYEFYSEISRKGIVLHTCSEIEFKDAESFIFKLAEEKIKDANFNSPLTFYEKEKILGINNNRKNSILYEFLKAERDSEEGYIPEYFEISFGDSKEEYQQGKNTAIKDFKVKDISVRGKIDRVDIDSSGKKFRVTDYKLSGKRPLDKELQTGISLQLPLYMYAAKQLIKAQLNKDFDPAGAAIFSLKYGEKNFGIKPLGMLSSNAEEIIKVCLDAIEKYVNDIVKGKFNLTTLEDRENKVCRFCSFKPVCRIQEVS
jgi:ATP-dependent helicase/nuclease subunit B